MKNILKDFIPHPPLINKEFLNGSGAKFISEYETRLIEFIEWKRIWGELENYDFESFEKEFIEILAEYLIRKNDFNLKFREEQSKKNQEEFINKTNIPVNDFKEAIYHYNHDLDEHIRLNIDYTDFLDERTPGNKEDAINKEMRSYNHKIHYLTLRAYQLGLDVTFTDKVKFNNIKENPDFQIETNSKFNKPQKFIILKELGVLEFLKEKYPRLSENGIGKILMDITGETNFQDKLNGHTNQGANDPYNNKDSVEIIKTHLMINRNIKLNEQ